MHIKYGQAFCIILVTLIWNVMILGVFVQDSKQELVGSPSRLSAYLKGEFYHTVSSTQRLSVVNNLLSVSSYENMGGMLRSCVWHFAQFASNSAIVYS